MSLLPGRYFIIPEDSYLHGDTLGLPVLPHPLPDLPVGFVKKGYLIVRDECNASIISYTPKGLLVASIQ